MRFTTIRAFRGLMLWNRALALLIMTTVSRKTRRPRTATLRRDTDIRQEGARLISLTRQPGNRAAPRAASLRLAEPEPGEFPAGSRKGAA
jgi:DNA-binding MurR/RpiR family transcriptional regulator